MITEAAGKMLDVTEAGIVKAADTAVSLGAWVVPICYRRHYARLRHKGESEAEKRAREECIIKGLGQLILETRKGLDGVELSQVQCLVEAVKPNLHMIHRYADVRDFDPRNAQLLEKLAPLHDENQ